MRKLFALFLLAGFAAAPAAAFAASPAPSGPVVDVVEVAGIIDIHVARYAIERIDAAERAHDTLVVFELNSLGGVKISDGQILPPLVRRIRDAQIPITVFIGPRGARAGSAALFIAEASPFVGIGPSARIERIVPADFAHPGNAADQRAELAYMGSLYGRHVTFARAHEIGANEAVKLGFADVVVPSVADMLRHLDGRTLIRTGGNATLSLPEKDVVIRFYQPGPIRRLLHAFANPGLLYLSLLAGALLCVFELFQPGFGVAGVSGGLLLVGAIYGLTVLPASVSGLATLAVSILLLTLDVARDELLLPTAAGAIGLTVGSIILFPSSTPFRLSLLLVVPSIVSALIFFGPVMTMVRRARRPVSTAEGGRLVGQTGDVRSVLNPEGFVWVGGELWRARTEEGTRMRVGEQIVVSSVEGTLLIVHPPPSGDPAVEGNGAATSSH